MSRLPSIMDHNFSRIAKQNLQRSSFDRSFGHKTTFDSSQLVPVMVDEVLPGDTINMSASFFARIATLLYPIMDNLFLDFFFFYVPNRLVWDNWERFDGAQDDPDSSIDFEIPYLEGDEGAFQVASFEIGDYMGLPIGKNFNDTPNSTKINALPFRGYHLIWNTWFRDQNTQSSVYFTKDDGPDDYSQYSIQYRGKRHDYFSSCLPWPQKGDAVMIPLGSQAPLSASTTGVRGNGEAMGFTDGNGNLGALATNGSDLKFDGGAQGTALPSGATFGSVASDRLMGVVSSVGESGLVAELTGIYADLSTATAATINQLREGIAVQQLLEMDARGGTRYIEQLKYQWGVQVEDYRLQRPEYLAGSSQPIGVRSVPSTVETATVPQANLAGYAQAGARCAFTKSFVEHGYVFGLANVRGDITYQQGLHKMWTRRTRYDFYKPVFAHLGEQAVLNQEIMYQDHADDIAAFGYQERWAEMRYKNSYTSGSFRSDAAATLDSWHLGQDFLTLPALDANFVEDDIPLPRVTALGASLAEGQQVLLDCYFKYRHARVMPVFSTPGLERL